MWRAAAAYSGFDEFVLRGTEELPRVGTPQIRYLRAPKHGRESTSSAAPRTSSPTSSACRSSSASSRRRGAQEQVEARSTYHDYYTDETRAKVAEVYAEDIDLFGYTY